MCGKANEGLHPAAGVSEAKRLPGRRASERLARSQNGGCALNLTVQITAGFSVSG